MLRPAFAESGIVQHAINQPLPGVRLWIVHKCRNLPGRGVHPQHDEVEPADEHRPPGQAGRGKALLGKLGEHK